MSRKPFWVYEEEKSLMRMDHEDEISRLQDKIRKLEEENSDLKKKVAEMENTLLIAMSLLLKPQSDKTSSPDG